MASATAIISLDSAKADRLDLSCAIAALIDRHGEDRVVASLAHTVGVRHILVAAGQCAGLALVCDNPLAAVPREPDTITIPGRRMIYYFAGCDGAKKLADRLGRGTFKIGYIDKLTLKERFALLDARAYAGLAANGDFRNQVDRNDWAKWDLARYEPCDTAHVVPPDGVSIDQNGLWHIVLPFGVDPDTFDRVMKALLAPRELAFWAQSGEGRLHCQARRLDPLEFVRFSYDPDTRALVRAEELYVATLRRDAAWFATILDQALQIVRKRFVAH